LEEGGRVVAVYFCFAAETSRAQLTKCKGCPFHRHPSHSWPLAPAPGSICSCTTFLAKVSKKQRSHCALCCEYIEVAAAAEMEMGAEAGQNCCYKIANGHLENKSPSEVFMKILLWLIDCPI